VDLWLVYVPVHQHEEEFDMKTAINTLLAALITLTALTLVSCGQTPENADTPGIDADTEIPHSPEDIVALYAVVLKTGDWESYVDLMHPSWFEDFRMGTLELVNTALMRGDTTDVIRLLETTDTTALAALAPDELFLRFIRNTNNGDPDPALEFFDFDIIGSVLEDDSLTHVISRVNHTKPGQEASQIETITLKRHGDRWYILQSNAFN
jgi:hypothetical protein